MKQNSPKPDNLLRKTFDRVTSPLQQFFQLEASSGIFLFVAAIIAMICANVDGLRETYFAFLNTPIGFSVAGFELNKSLLLLVNDGLMAIFFYLIGLEIKREILVGELSVPKKAAFSIFAAIGGMAVPALIFAGFNWDSPSLRGWGIPMATDIAFAIGVITLLGKRVSDSLKILLLSVAIVDDLGAISIIAIFYSEEIATNYLGMASASLFALFLLNYAGFRNVVWGLVLGVVTWFCFLKSGVHATIAGVLLAFLTPARPIDTKGNIKDSGELLLDHYIHAIHPWAAFFIMPVFAFFNAGVSLQGLDLHEVVTSPVTLGIVFGLVLGKPLGVFLFSYAATKMNWTIRPTGITWSQVGAVGMVAGIGFTMSLFIGSLAYAGGDAETLSKVAILVASLIAIILGYLGLRGTTSPPGAEKG